MKDDSLFFFFFFNCLVELQGESFYGILWMCARVPFSEGLTSMTKLTDGRLKNFRLSF